MQQKPHSSALRNARLSNLEVHLQSVVFAVRAAHCAFPLQLGLGALIAIDDVASGLRQVIRAVSAAPPNAPAIAVNTRA